MMTLTQASEVAEFWTVFVCKSLGVPDLFFKEITPEKQIEFFSLQDGLIKEESNEPDVLFRFLDRERLKVHCVFRHDDPEYIFLTQVNLIMYSYDRGILFSEVLGWFGWGRCLTCKNTHESDDNEIYCYPDGHKSKNFGCIHYKYSGDTTK